MLLAPSGTGSIYLGIRNRQLAPDIGRNGERSPKKHKRTTLEITIYTDGSALGNPGPGGYGVVMLAGRFRKELSQGYRLTTNNRMELMAVCVALETLRFEGSDVTLYSDSKYVVDAVTKGWVFGWERKGFAGKKNPDLWMRFLRIYRRHHVRFVWVKGHAETVENNRCDQLAVAAANDRLHLLEDTGYTPGA
ncbi:MAG TPA: ribonuclease HI [Candidatus Alistipes stercorigallinarum]|nr:ribonuclease HI [Candidatus Alistipes stercorigallinarum]